MRSLVCVWSLSLVALLGACTIQEAEDDGAGGVAGQAGGGAGGAGGATAGTGGTVGGAGGALPDACEGVPPEGTCTGDGQLSRCIVAEGEGAEPMIVTAPCKGGMICVASATGASCELQGSCLEGASECESPTSVRTCVGGQWQVSSCGGADCVASAGHGAICAQQAAGTPHPIRGRITYEFRDMNEDRNGYGDIKVDDARRVIVSAYDGDEYIGGAYTELNDGTFEIEAIRPPTADTWLFVFPLLFNDQGTPQFAVAVPSSYTYADLRSEEYWYFPVPTNGQSDVGTVLVKESEGSGALRIHQYLLFGIQQAAALAPQVQAFNVLALWKPGERFDCGNGTCYVPKGWGAVVQYDAEYQDLYQGAVLLAGTTETPHHWSKSVMLHELGHYMMDAYSLSPREAGQHWLTKPEPPGQAWSEGWATYYGQSMMQNPIYFDLQEGTAFWVDSSAPMSSAPMPDPNGPIDQEIGEMVVTAMLWHLFDENGSGADAWDQADLGQQAIWDAFTSERVTNTTYNRGYHKVDFVDMLDALRCQGAPAGAVLSVTDHYGFPYDDAYTCAQ